MKANKIPRVPVIMQMEATECGAASLAMICAYYKKWIPLAKIREDCGISRDGSNAGRVCRAARSYGLTARGYRLTADKLDTLPMPAVIFCLDCHFTVLKGFKNDKVYINDPENGMVTMTKAEFGHFYSGVVLCFEKGEEFVPEGKEESVWKFAGERLKGLGFPFFLLAVTGIIIACSEALTPYLSQRYVSQILPNPFGGNLKPFLVAAFCVCSFQFLFSIASALYMLRVRASMAVVSNSMFLWHVLRLPVNFFLQRSLGDLVTRQNSNETIAETMFSQLMPTIMNSIMAVFFGVIMFWYHPTLALIAVGAVCVNLISAGIISRMRVNLARVQSRDNGMLTGYTMSGINMAETIKATGSEQEFFQNWSGRYAKASNSNIEFQEKNKYLSPLPGIIYQLSSLLILILGAYLIIDEQFTLGMLLAFQGYMGYFTSPMLSLQSSIQGIMEVRNSMERINDVLQYKTDVPDQDVREEESHILPKGYVEFKNVTFGYSQFEKPLLENISFKVEPGKTIAVVGLSGSGKSTIAKLLCGTYKPWSGQILIDKMERSLYPRSVLSASMAIVDQDISLFDDTVINNIKMWDSTISDTDVYQAATDADIHDVILKREKGYEHGVFENGKNFSGGQRQRIEIARALAGNPSVLILDEATAALDASTELEVMQAIEKRGITLIIIAHRLSTVRRCNEIIVLDNGKIVESGTHQELYAFGGVYKTLVTTQ